MQFKSIFALSLLTSITQFATPLAFSGERIEFENDTTAVELETIEFQQIDADLQTAIRETERSLPGYVTNKDTGEKIGAVCEEAGPGGDCKSYSFYLWSIAGAVPVKLNQAPISPEQVITLFHKKKIQFKKIPFFGVTKFAYRTKNKDKKSRATGWSVTGTDYGRLALPIVVSPLGLTSGIIAICAADVALTASASLTLGIISLSFAAPIVAMAAGPTIIDVAKAPIMYSYVLIDKIVRQGKEGKKAKVVGKLIRTLVNESGAPSESVSNKNFLLLKETLQTK